MAVVRVPEKKTIVSSVEVEEGNSTLKLPGVGWNRLFGEKLRGFLYEDGAFREGSELKIRYRVFQQENLATVLFPVSRGSVIIEAKYIGDLEKELATIQVEVLKVDERGFGKDLTGNWRGWRKRSPTIRSKTAGDPASGKTVRAPSDLSLLLKDNGFKERITR